MKVAILTMFNGLLSIYSLVNVVAEQLKMLLDANIEVKLLVSEDCGEEERYGIYLDPRIEWVRICNRYKGELIHWRDYRLPDMPLHDTLFEEARVIGEDLLNNLQDVEVCIMHDIHYQGWHFVHNLAVRYVAEKLPKLRFIAMTHSMPDLSQVGKNVEWPYSIRYSEMPNTVYAYPTESGLRALAKQYNVYTNRCKVINNSIDLLASMSQEVQDIHRKVDLLSPEILIIYPARLTTGKKFEKVVYLAGAIKRVSSCSIKVIFCEYAALDTSNEAYKELIRRIGIEEGLKQEDIVFTSELGYPIGLERNSILDLFTLSNLFIHPSLSESFGLTVLEAASRGNFVVLNEAVHALQEVGKDIGAYFMRWDARNFEYMTTETYHPSEKAYNEEHAKCILQLMNQDKVLMAKTKVRLRYSSKWIFENQLRPLLFNDLKA